VRGTPTVMLVDGRKFRARIAFPRMRDERIAAVVSR
jgi:hypothetical protein